MDLSFTQDINLINALKVGESKAYTYLVNSYHHKLCVYAYNLTNDHTLSEDIVQNVFMNVWKQRHKLKEDFVIKSYLYKSVYNEFIDQYRKHKKVLALEKYHIEALSAIVEEEDKNSFEKLIKLVKLEIENLPPKCKQTFLLSKKEGLTNIEIAEYMNVSIKSVEAHITKAFRLIRKKTKIELESILIIIFDIPKKRIY